MSHPDIDPGSADRLRAAPGLPLAPESENGEPVSAGATSTSPAPPTHGRGLKARVRAGLKKVLRPVLERARRFVRENATQVTEDALAAQQERVGHTEAELAVLEAEVRAVTTWMSSWLAVDGAQVAEDARAARTNVELLKSELADVLDVVERIGRAIAPDAGPAAAAARFAELRERVDAIDRRVRRLAEPRAAAQPSGGGSGEAGAVTPPAPGSGDGFDYLGFEHRFRGEATTVLDALVARYADRLAERAPVLDVGCGRGELLAALAERGVEGRGVDLDPEMADEARARGVEVTVADAVQHLETLADGSLGAIVAIHLVEHLPLATLTRLLELAAAKIRPGGIAIFETPNPTSLIVLGNSYILDPTHQWPLHPSLLAFMCERAGFRDIELQWWSPATDYHLPWIEGLDEPWAATVNEAFDQLNQVLFGPQEYAIIATTPPA